MPNKFKIKYAGREVTFYRKTKRLEVYFPNGTVFVCTSFPLKKFKLKKDGIWLLQLLTMPYEFINNKFLGVKQC